MRRKTKVIAIIAIIVILSMTTAAFALAAGQPAVGPPSGTWAPDTNVTFTITTNNYGLQGAVNTSPNLTLVSQAPGVDGMGFGARPASFMVANTAQVTYTYRIAADAEPGDVFWFDVTSVIASDDEGETTNIGNLPRASGTVIEDDDGGDNGGGGNGGGGGGRDDVPKVGDEPANALPAALIGLAVIGALGVVGYVKLR
jgi:hypothetical protein